jgi:hypothetical protein
VEQLTRQAGVGKGALRLHPAGCSARITNEMDFTFRTSLAALATFVAVAAPAAADPVVTLDRTCYAPGDTITRTGSGFTPGAQVTESVAFQTQDLPTIALGSLNGPTIAANPQGAFKDTISAPRLRRETKDYTETAIDTFTDPGNPAKPAVVQWTLSAWSMSVPAWSGRAARVGQPMTVYAYGWTSTGTTLYMHYFRGTKRYKTVRVGRLTGACGDLSKHLVQFPFSHPKPGAWKVFFSTTKLLDKQGDAWIALKVRVPR